MFAFSILKLRSDKLLRETGRRKNRSRIQSKSVPKKTKKASFKKDEELEVEIKVNKKRTASSQHLTYSFQQL